MHEQSVLLSATSIATQGFVCFPLSVLRNDREEVYNDLGPISPDLIITFPIALPNNNNILFNKKFLIGIFTEPAMKRSLSRVFVFLLLLFSR